MKIIFLDIDGVLNIHGASACGRTRIEPECMTRLNKILDATGAKVVITSNWRDDIVKGFMTVTGFAIMLYTHGMKDPVNRVIGYTADMRNGCNRKDEIIDWMLNTPVRSIGRWITIDDIAMDLSDIDGLEHFVKTDASTGLTDADVAKAIEMLGGKE